jgi:hypothetical protein
VSAPQPIPNERIVIHADGQSLCVECAEMLYHGQAGCSECGRRGATGITSVGALHKGCGGVFRAWDSQRDLIIRRVLRNEAAPVKCAMCDALVGGA